MSGHRYHRRFIHFLALILPILVLVGLVLHSRNPQEQPSSQEEPAARATTQSRQIPPSPGATIDPSQATAWQLIAAKQEADRRAEASAGPRLPNDFLDRHVTGKRVTFPLPDQTVFVGEIESSERDAKGLLSIDGRTTQPFPGRFFIQRQTAAGVAGPFVGNIRFDGKPHAWKIEPSADASAARFVLREIDSVLCVNYAPPPEEPQAGDMEPQNAPQTHPFPIPIPGNISIVPLQSLPGATAVVYLDFDGEKGPFTGWGNFDALPANATNAQIFDVWKMVCEDYQGFNINITTDRRVFDSAPVGRRQQIIVTPTTDASPGAGGVAYLNSFNWSPSRPCWCFYSSGKSAAEVISHEIGHTLGLSHDGRTSPAETYYAGHGSGDTAWAPIMGVGYSRKLTQWSKGEYLNANQKQDDLAIITTKNNSVAYRADDYGANASDSGYLEILPNNSVSNEGILETTGDVDSFRFSTTGGSVSLTASTVTLNPNLDLLAEIVDANTLAVITSNNPDTALNATVSANLPAGDYLLRIRGTGRGNPLETGYTNYGCIGSYLVTGSVTGGLKPDRFSIAENSPAGTTVGNTPPRLNHGTNPLAWSIASGNTGGAFAIDPATGAITVANPSVLNFEALSSRWDVPAVIQLFIRIDDLADANLNETIRTVVTITDVNEAPAASGVQVTMLERTAAGTVVSTIAGSDVDRYDFPSYSITGGNTGGAFAIHPVTGVITVAAPVEVATDAVYNLQVTLTDQRSPSMSTNVPADITVVNIAPGYTPGSIVRTFFENISGTSVTNLTGNTRFPNNPDREQFLTSFDGAAYGDNFGSTIRGYLIPPATGRYRFWIASDDASQLRFSTSSNPASATSIASVSTSTGQYAWTTNPSQQSAEFNLTAGQAYYIEARHKEGTGGDHVAVAWTGPGIATRQVIPGLYLVPFYQNYAPKITAATFTARRNAISGQTVGFVPVTDVNAQDTFSAFTITAGNGSGIFGVDPASGRLFIADGAALEGAASSHSLTIRVSDSGSPALTGSGTITVNLQASDVINLAGIHQEVWSNINGSALTNLTGNANYPHRPGSRRTLTSFDSGASFADNYGSRIRARFTPPASGDYRFYIASDDDSRLLFSTDVSGTGATQIASVTGWTNTGEWTKYSTQTSTVRTLVAGQPVYLEALHKEAGGGDHVSVAYTGPGVSTPTVIPGSMLAPFDINTPPAFSPASYAFTIHTATATAGQTLGTVTASDPNGEALAYAIVSGNPAGAFAIHPGTGAITVANPAALAEGLVTLQIRAQDGGLGSVYPLKSATAVVTITVTSPNEPPVFASDPFRFTAAAGMPLVANITASDPNPGNLLTFSKSSGPAWLDVAADGVLTGTPPAGSEGVDSFIVRVTDGGGLFDEAALEVTVLASPTWIEAAGGAWPGSANWLGGIIAEGPGITADFASLDLAADTLVTLDGHRTLGTLDFADASPSHDWVLAPGTAGMLTLASPSGTPSIRVRNRAVTLAAALGGGQGITKLGAGTLILSNPENPISGVVTVAQGELVLNGSLDSAGIQVSPAARLSGSGRVAGALTHGGILSPGHRGIGTLTVQGALTLEPGSRIDWEIGDSAGPAGSGHDSIRTHGLTLLATQTEPLVIRILTAQPGSFNEADQTFTLVSNSGPLNGFDAARVALDTSDFSSGLGTWAVATTGNDLVLTYTHPAGASPFIDSNHNAMLDSWEIEKFGNSAQGANPPDEDADLDGMSNFLEYALDTHPAVPGTNPLTYDTPDSGGEAYLTLSVPKNPLATNLLYLVEVAHNPGGPWLSDTTVDTEVLTNTPSLLVVRDRTAVSAAKKRFIRLRVIALPSP